MGLSISTYLILAAVILIALDFLIPTEASLAAGGECFEFLTLTF